MTSMFCSWGYPRELEKCEAQFLVQENYGEHYVGPKFENPIYWKPLEEENPNEAARNIRTPPQVPWK